MERLFFGYSEVEITPVDSVQMIGFGKADEWSRGVRSPLLAQVSVWRLNKESGCLVAIDHIGFSKQHADETRDAIGEALGFSRDSVMLCFSHTHAGPNDSVSQAWYEATRGRLTEAAREAASTMRPVRAAWGNAKTNIGVNRRAGCDEVDRRVGVLKVADASDGSLRLILLRLTVHANVLKGDNDRLSSDCFGTLRDALKAKYNCPIMITQGASGDIAPRYFCSVLTPPDATDERFVRAEDALERMAQDVLSDVSPLTSALVPLQIERFSMKVRFLALKADVPTLQRAREVASEAKAICGIDGSAWLAEVERLNRSGVCEQTETVEVQYFMLGDACLCGVPNELMTAFALRAERALDDEHFYLGGYTNGCTGYFPSEEAFDEGGYEVYWSMLNYYPYYGRVFPLRRESASAFLTFVTHNR